MSVLTVQTGWIVGTPDSASQLVTQIVTWVTLNTPWVPDESALQDIENLRREVMTAYDIEGEGYCAFATQIVDSVLNRLYPYLIEVSKDTGAKISSSREKALDGDDNQIVKYTLVTTYDEDQPKDDQGNGLPNIEGNPFPLPTEITPSPVTPIPGSPNPVYEPLYPGLPYNPLDPLSRESNPYPPRNEQPNVPFTPGDTNVPGSPIQERPTYGEPVEDYREMLESLPRSGEIELTGSPVVDTEKPPEENQTGEEEETEEEEKDEEEKLPDELIPLLKRILYEIENQGTLTRQALTESVLSILGGMAEQTSALHSGIATSEELLGKVIANNAAAEQGILKEILSALEDAQGASDDTESDLLALLGESLDEVADWIKQGLRAVSNAVDSGLDGVKSALASIGGILESGFDALAEAVTHGLTAVKDSMAEGNKAWMDWIANAFEFNPDDFSKYLCAFLTEIEKCKECGYLKAHKEG